MSENKKSTKEKENKSTKKSTTIKKDNASRRKVKSNEVKIEKITKDNITEEQKKEAKKVFDAMNKADKEKKEKEEKLEAEKIKEEKLEEKSDIKKKDSKKKDNKKKKKIVEYSAKDFSNINALKKEQREKKQKKAKNRKFISGLFISLIILLVSGALLYPLFKNVKFGLDLQGGFEILYEVQDVDGKKVSKESVTNTYKTILKRIDILGVSEPEISIEGNNIRIQLAGVNDKNQAKKTLSSMANLTFRNSKDELVMTSDVLKPNGVKVAYDDKNVNNVGSYYLDLEIADVDTFHEKTEEIRKAGDLMVIWLDFEEGEDSYLTKCNKRDEQGNPVSTNCLSSATINGELTGTHVSLTGNFTQEEATELADLINSGSLPTKLVELSSKTVDASFGKDALRNTFIAGAIAVGIIALTMILIYRFSGFVASIGIIAYTMLTFTIFNLVGGRLTLPSIAAVVIGIGMAVDSTVLSFERIKDELRTKNSLEDSFIKGNKGALVSILDANVTTMIAAVILFIFGESSVKGFATMLIISIIVTLFVMVYLVRFMLRKFVDSDKFNNHYRAFIGIKDVNKKSVFTKFNYVKHTPKFVALTLILIVVGGISFYFNKLNLSIDFKGGSSISLSTKEKIDKDDIKSELEELEYKVQNIDNIDDNTIYATINSTLENEDIEKIENHFTEKYEHSTTSIGSVSNTVKKELIKNAVKSLLLAAIGIIIYVSLRFTIRYGIAAIITLLHDVLMIILAFSVLKLEVSTIFIAAILSIIGYSINDTIVTFDRIRENKRNMYKDKVNTYSDLKKLVNTSIKETITRSIITSLTTLIPVISLLILGSHEIVNFNYALLIGLIAGTYSSIFIATRLWLSLEKKHVGKEEKKKWYEVDDKDELEELKVKGINC